MRINLPNGLTIDDSKELLDLDLITNYLHFDSYWAKNRTERAILKSIENSWCFGLYRDRLQVGFARVITDRSTFYYLADVFVLDNYQGHGYGKQLMDYITNHPDLINCRAILTTQTAHSFYEQYGFTQNHEIISERLMVKSP